MGLSGGIDSALVAYLVAEAIGADRLLCVLMPYRTSSPASRSDAEEVVRRLGCASELVEITPIVDGYFGAGRRGRAPAGPRRSRRPRSGAATSWPGRGCCVLYDRSVTWRGLVVGTGNKTESLIGYTTLFGDSACAFNPIGDLYKSQVRQLSAAVGVPEAIIRKAPSADLWPGQTDEAEAGFSYPELDRLLFWMVDRRRSDDELVAMGFEPAVVERVGQAGRGLRVQAPGAADREARAADARGRLPLPAAPAGLGTSVKRGPGATTDVGTRTGPRRGRGRRCRARATGTAGRERPRGGRLYVVATPIGNLGDVSLRALEVLRAVPLVAAEDTRITRRLFARYEITTHLVPLPRAQRAGDRARRCWRTSGPGATWRS